MTHPEGVTEAVELLADYVHSLGESGNTPIHYGLSLCLRSEVFGREYKIIIGRPEIDAITAIVNLNAAFEAPGHE